MSQAEQALPDALRAGDPQAFEELVRRNTPRLLSVTRRILKNDDEAREAVQQAFISAFKSREQFHGSPLLGWRRAVFSLKPVGGIGCRSPGSFNNP